MPQAEGWTPAIHNDRATPPPAPPPAARRPNFSPPWGGDAAGRGGDARRPQRPPLPSPRRTAAARRPNFLPPLGGRCRRQRGAPAAHNHRPAPHPIAPPPLAAPIFSPLRGEMPQAEGGAGARRAPRPPHLPPRRTNAVPTPSRRLRPLSVAPDLIWGPNPTPFAAQRPEIAHQRLFTALSDTPCRQPPSYGFPRKAGMTITGGDGKMRSGGPSSCIPRRSHQSQRSTLSWGLSRRVRLA